MNLSLGEEWTAKDLQDATTGACPACGLRVELGTLVVGDGRGKRDNQKPHG